MDDRLASEVKEYLGNIWVNSDGDIKYADMLFCLCCDPRQPRQSSATGAVGLRKAFTLAETLSHTRDDSGSSTPLHHGVTKDTLLCVIAGDPEWAQRCNLAHGNHTFMFELMRTYFHSSYLPLERDHIFFPFVHSFPCFSILHNVDTTDVSSTQSSPFFCRC